MTGRRDGERSGGGEIHVVGAAILDGGTCLAVQRGAAMSQPLQWEFPGGKVEAGETPQEALSREIIEELGVEIRVGELLGTGTAPVSAPGGRKVIRLDVYQARIVAGTVELREHRDQRWLTAAELPQLTWAAADRPVLPRLASLLEGFSLSRGSGTGTGAASS